MVYLIGVQEDIPVHLSLSLASLPYSVLFNRGIMEITAPVAQWIERLTSNQQVGGSNPSGCASNVAVSP